MHVIKSYVLENISLLGKKNGSYKSIKYLFFINISARAGPWPQPKSKPFAFGLILSIKGLESLDKKFL